MKSTLILVFMMISFNCYSQDCEGVRKYASELTEEKTYRSNAIWFDKNSCVSVMSIGKDTSSRRMTLIFTNFNEGLSYSLKGLFIKLTDGTFYRFPETKVGVEYDGGTRFEYRALFILKPNEIIKLKEHGIESANFGYSGDVSLTVEDSKKLSNYISCIYSLK